MKRNLFVSGLLGLVAAAVYFASAANRAFPNLIAPISGVVAVVTVFHLVRLFVLSSSARSGEGRPSAGDDVPATLAALVAALVFMLSPAVRLAAARLEPRLLGFTWAILIVALAVPFLSCRARATWVFPALAGVAVGIGLADSALFLTFLPFYVLLVVQVARKAGSSAARFVSTPAFSVCLFLAVCLLTLAGIVWGFHLNVGLFLRRTMAELASYYRIPGWFFVFCFTTLPFLTVLFSEDGALRERPGSVQLLFHGALTFVTVLAVLPPLSPFALMEPYGRLPVATSAFAAAVSGYLVIYWWRNRRLKTALAIGGILCLVLAGSAVWNAISFGDQARAFAGRTARKVVVKMDQRRAQEILRKNPGDPLANYVMGSLSLKAGRNAEAETYLRKAAESPKAVPFALNDLAEVLRRDGKYAEAERHARACVERAPKMYVAWETLGSVLMDAGKDLGEAESAIRRACELSKGKDGRTVDVRMLVSLARVQLKRGASPRARETIREIESRQKELSPSDRAAFEDLLKSSR